MSITIIPDCKCKPVVDDLLAALKELLPYAHVFHAPSDIAAAIARAAIAKAEGVAQ